MVWPYWKKIKMRNIVIIGNTTGAEILYGYLQKDSRYKVMAFSVDAAYITDSKLCGLDVVPLAELTRLYHADQINVLLGVGYNGLNAVRSELYHRVKSMGFLVETYIHPTATILTESPVGEGSVILASTVVEPFAEIGYNSFVWCNCTIAHHARVGDHAWIASNTIISGQAGIGDRTFVGVGAVVANKVRVAEDNLIGGGAFISRDTHPNEVWLARSAEKHRFDAQTYAGHFLV